MKYFFIFLKITVVAAILFAVLYIEILRKETKINRARQRRKVKSNISGSIISKRKYRILYYNPSPFIRLHRKYALSCGFDKCKWNNCEMTFVKRFAYKSDAVIFDGINIPMNIGFSRPYGQVWIFAAHESPLKYNMGGNWWYKKKYSFNWTMTYDKDNADIYLPYGEIRKREKKDERDFEALSFGKSNTPLMIASNCHTPARRQDYVRKLRKYIDINILGACGNKTWECGIHYRHDDHCFQILNTTYKFYLAFENALCHDYFSEKFFENFNYDTIMITRGGLVGDTKKHIPEGIHIATENFRSVKALAMYLKNLTTYDYAQMLKKKSQYYSTGFKPVYQRALCEICYRMNFQKRFKKTIKNIKHWAFASKPCLFHEEVKDIR